MFLSGLDVSRSCVGGGVRAPLLWGHRAIHRPPGMTGTCTCRSSALFISSGLECQVLLASPLLKIPVDPSKPSSSGTTLCRITLILLPGDASGAGLSLILCVGSRVSHRAREVLCRSFFREQEAQVRLGLKSLG